MTLDVPSNELLRSVHTSNLPSILDELNISLLVTTYQAGKLVMLRPACGVLNTHFRVFEKPMGLASNQIESPSEPPCKSGGSTTSQPPAKT